MTYSRFRENMLVCVDTLRSHKARSTLTILGIVIGVTSVISVASIINGLNGYISAKVQSMGSRTFFISRIPAGKPIELLPQKIRIRKYIDYSDAAYLRDAVPELQRITTFGTRAFALGQNNSISYGNQRVERLFVRGAEPEFSDAIPMFAVDEGRFLSAYDEKHAQPVVILGTDIVETLFPHTDPIGKTVKLNGAPFEVIGVFVKDSGFLAGAGVNQFAVIPLSTYRKNYPEAKELAIAFTVPATMEIEGAKDRIVEAMRRRRHVRPQDDDDFDLISPDFLSSLWNELTGALVILATIISSVGLLVGGIGVMNIMLISVTERTSEIGIRKAIGARRSDIRVQFLLEAMVLSSIGGLLGIVLGAGVAFLVRTLLPSVPATLSYLWVVIGVTISVGVGLFFGYYPANRAANLDPIVCLRYE